MCGRKLKHIVFVLFLAFVLPSFLLMAQEKKSTQNYSQQNGLWNQLLELTQKIPIEFENYQANLLRQIALLQNNLQLLIASNIDLKNKNELLEKSLTISQDKVLKLEKKSEQLQTDLDNSIIAINNAQKENNKIKNNNKILFIISISLGTLLVGDIIYNKIKEK